MVDVCHKKTRKIKLCDTVREISKTSAQGLWYWVLVPYDSIVGGPHPGVGYNADGELEQATCYDVMIREDVASALGIHTTQRVTYEQFLADRGATAEINKLNDEHMPKPTSRRKGYIYAGARSCTS